MANARKRSANPNAWRNPASSPITLLRGSEEFIAIRVIDTLCERLREEHPDLETHRASAADYAAGELTVLASPSLFGETKLLIFTDLEKMTDSFLSDALEYLKDPNPDVTMILWHTGGNRGQRLLKALSNTAQIIACDPLKTERAKTEFVQAEFRDARRRIEAPAIKALVDAVGTDTSELASAIDQLLTDTSGAVTEKVVNQYYGGRIQATSFRVADAALVGRGAEAVTLLRHALASGVHEALITSVFATKTRQIARVIDGRMSQGQIAKTLGMPPWQAQRVMDTRRFWTPQAIAHAMEVIAQTDIEVKGDSRSPQYSVEKMVTTVASNARRR